MREPRNLQEWFTECRKIPDRDEDCIILWTGEERSGKSNCAIQIMPLLDPTFNVQRIAFDIDSFFPIVSDLPKRHAALLDEARVNSRKAMTRETIRLLDYLQVCGGLNHYIGLCYPRAHRLDGAIAERARYNIHMDSRTRALMRVYTGDDDRPWRTLFPFKVGRAPDTIRLPYTQAKDAAARARLREETRSMQPEGVSRAALVSDLASLRADHS